MKCKKHEEKIILYLYGELGESERAELEEHIKECPVCSRDLAYTKKVLKLLDEVKEEIPEANWQKCWKEIDSGIGEKFSKKKTLFALPQWAYAAAALVIIFAAGIIIGRFWFFSGQKPATQTAASQSAIEIQLKEYIQDLKPILVEYANYTPVERGEGTVTMDREIARRLLVQNILLRKIVTETNPSLLQFLEDVDVVLKEIANLKKDDKQTPPLIKELIDQKEILFKMEILQKI